MAESNHEVKSKQTIPSANFISNCLRPSAGLCLGVAAIQAASTIQYHCNNEEAQKLLLLIT